MSNVFYFHVVKTHVMRPLLNVPGTMTEYLAKSASLVRGAFSFGTWNNLAWRTDFRRASPSSGHVQDSRFFRRRQ